jgi:sugar/nucleoside kinase (ribokinase family)
LSRPTSPFPSARPPSPELDVVTVGAVGAAQAADGPALLVAQAAARAGARTGLVTELDGPLGDRIGADARACGIDVQSATRGAEGQLVVDAGYLARARFVWMSGATSRAWPAAGETVLRAARAVAFDPALIGGAAPARGLPRAHILCTRCPEDTLALVGEEDPGRAARTLSAYAQLVAVRAADASVWVAMGGSVAHLLPPDSCPLHAEAAAAVFAGALLAALSRGSGPLAASRAAQRTLSRWDGSSAPPAPPLPARERDSVGG